MSNVLKTTILLAALTALFMVIHGAMVARAAWRSRSWSRW
jgi:ABC-type Fe3+ transport system permease subunit